MVKITRKNMYTYTRKMYKNRTKTVIRVYGNKRVLL